MSNNTTIIQLRQSEAENVARNGVYSTTLNNPIELNEGDVVELKSVFLDTVVEDKGYIKIPNDLNIKMSCYMYLQNYAFDQTYAYQQDNPPEFDRLRIYGNQGDNGSGINYGLDTVRGDNNIWWLSQVRTPDTTKVAWVIYDIDWACTLPKNDYRHTYLIDVGYEYDDIQLGITDKTFHISRYRTRVADNFSPADLGVRGYGTNEAPHFKILTSPDVLLNHNIDPTAFKVNAYKLGSNGEIIMPQEFVFTFDIASGTYTPAELGKIMTVNLNDLEKSGSVYAGLDVANDRFSFNTPLLTSVLQNDKKLQTDAAAGGYTSNQVFVVSQLNKHSPEIDGKFYFKYDIDAMKAEYNAANPYRATLDRFIGTNQISIEFDEDEQKMKFTLQHFPIYNNLNDTEDPNALPALCYNNVIDQASGEWSFSTGLATRYGGIAWASLSSVDSITKLNTNFFNDIGFSNATITPISTGVRMNYPLASSPAPGFDNSFYMTPIDAKNITGGFPGLDIPVIKTNSGYSAPLQEELNLVPQFVGTTLTSSIFGNSTFNDSPETEGYYLIEIGSNFKQKFMGGKFTQQLNGIQSIVNRYYTQNSFTSDQGAGSIVYQHSGAPMLLTELNVRVLNPNLSSPTETQIGANNTIFVSVIKSGAVPTSNQ